MDGIENAKRSLDGLSVGDAFGMELLKRPYRLVERWLPSNQTYRWTDDTAMAVSIVEVLGRHGRIDQDDLAESFAAAYEREPYRGYGYGAKGLLRDIGSGASWRKAAKEMFGGQGSYGNGGAMRAAPIGAFFATDASRAGSEAALSAEVTHAHPEGQAGAIAVAVAASLFSREETRTSGEEFIEAVMEHTPQGATRMTMAVSRGIASSELQEAIDVLGTGRGISAQDTVPFCIWIVAHHRRSFEDAMWQTITGMNDGDTTCAIVGGILASGGVFPPSSWLASREELPTCL